MPRCLIGFVNEDRRNSMKDVLPQFLEPMTRMLRRMLDRVTVFRTKDLLEGFGILLPANSARTIRTSRLVC